MQQLQILNQTQVDFGTGELAGIGGIQPGEGLHVFVIVDGHLTSSKEGNPQIYFQASVKETFLGEASVGKSNKEWQSLPNSKQDPKNRLTTQAFVNRMLFSILGQALTGMQNLTDEWVGKALVGREFVGYYFPFVDGKDNEGVKLESATIYLSRAVPQPDGSVIDEVALVQSGQKTINRPKNTIGKKVGGAPGYSQAMTQIAGGAVPAIPGIPGLPGMPGTPNVAPGAGAGFTPAVPNAAALLAVPGVPAVPANGVSGLPPIPG